MAENSNIQWCDHTFNPWIGCTKVSPGCANCYAETLDKNRFSKTLPGGTKDAPVSHWGKGAPRHRTSASNWKQPLKWNSQASGGCGDCDPCIGGRYDQCAVDPIRRPRVFCASLADWLDDEVPIEWLADLLELIRLTPNLDWLLLTKRPENWKERIGLAARFNREAEKDMSLYCSWGHGNPPANVWIGTTVEDGPRKERLDQLRAIPARIRFLSCEPLLADLGYINLANGINWVITGGESGPGCRPADVEWFRSLKDQCAAAGVAYFQKQLGGVRDHRGTISDFPEDLRIRQFPTSIQ